MYEVDISTLMIVGIDEHRSKIITLDNEFDVDYSAKDIINYSCKYFGHTLTEQSNFTSRITGIHSKCPIVIEESRNIIFFPLKSLRSDCNIWISFNNLDRAIQDGKDTIFQFKNNVMKKISFSFYIVDNQITRSMLLDYTINKKRESLEK